MGLITKNPNPADKTVTPEPRVHGTTLKPTPSSDKSRRPYGRPFHKPRQSGTLRPFGPQ
jgi:hypothetical protein